MKIAKCSSVASLFGSGVCLGLGTNKNMKVSGRSAGEKVKECGKGQRFRNNQPEILG